jgi:TolA-binding protein
MTMLTRIVPSKKNAEMAETIENLQRLRQLDYEERQKLRMQIEMMQEEIGQLSSLISEQETDILNREEQLVVMQAAHSRTVSRYQRTITQYKDHTLYLKHRLDRQAELIHDLRTPVTRFVDFVMGKK